MPGRYGDSWKTRRDRSGEDGVKMSRNVLPVTDVSSSNVHRTVFVIWLFCTTRKGSHAPVADL